MTPDYDTVIIGGAITGTSTAYHLLKKQPGLRVCIVEADPTFKYSATALSTAGVRVLFSQRENIEMSKYGHSFFASFRTLFPVGLESSDLHFRKQGYLFIANSSAQAEEMRLNFELQQEMGCDVRLMDKKGLKSTFPEYFVEDVFCAAYSPSDGWIDSMAAVDGMTKIIRSLGAEVIHDRVIGIDSDGARVTGVSTEKGRKLSCGHLVNAAGAWSKFLCEQIGMKLPVEPLPRMVYFFNSEDTLSHLPLTLDGHGAGFRPEGQGFISGVTDYSRVGKFCSDVDYRHFDDEVWPRVAVRVPAFERIRLQSAWVGHYDQNTFDGNVILGSWIHGYKNFYVTAGSSGHGLQHAPAIGRAIAELILEGKFSSIDLTRMTYQRLLDDRPYPERGARA